MGGVFVKGWCVCERVVLSEVGTLWLLCLFYFETLRVNFPVIIAWL